MSTETRKVVIASRNPDKVGELAALMEDLPFAVVAADAYPGLPEVIEDGTTVEGNATRKALVTAAYTGEIAVADDTSLQVRELNRLPDIFAARFSGPDATYASNAALLLELMEGVPDGCRQARFTTACAWIDPRPTADCGPVAPPATARWLHNPWAGGRRLPTDRAREHFRGLIDHVEVWEHYRTELLADLVSWGHDRARLRELAEELVAAAVQTGTGPEGSVRLPDPRIWATPLREGDQPATTVIPPGLPEDAPGLPSCARRFFQITAEAKLLGTVTREPLGTGGFGYDPVFRPEGEQRTLAEMTPAEKNALSHRGHALRRLLRAVRASYPAARRTPAGA